MIAEAKDADTDQVETAERTDEQPAQQAGGGWSRADGESSREQILEMARQLALGEAMKPLEPAILALHSPDPDRQAARKTLNEAYSDAAKQDGKLAVKFEAAKKSFDRAVKDMDTDRHIEGWLEELTKSDGKLRKLLKERAKLDTTLAPALEKNDRDRTSARAEAKRLAERFAEWSDPVGKIDALIGTYAEKIDKLNSDINNDVNRSVALTTFWFEMAPKHLQLAPELSDAVRQVIDAVRAAVKDFPDLKRQLTLGHARGEHEHVLWLIGGGKLQDKRQKVLDSWKASAVALAEAEAAFKLAPDDAATLKQRFDKLKSDAWLAEARKLLEQPAP